MANPGRGISLEKLSLKAGVQPTTVSEVDVYLPSFVVSRLDSRLDLPWLIK